MALRGMSSTHRRENFLAVRPNRRKGHTAVADQRRRHAVPGDRCQLRIPANLCVQVGVQVEKTRRCHRAVGVDLALAFLPDLAAVSAMSAVSRDPQVALPRTG